MTHWKKLSNTKYMGSWGFGVERDWRLYCSAEAKWITKQEGILHGRD